MKRLLKFITCGSVDDGKSTLIGHMLYDAKLLFADREKALLLDSKVGSAGGDVDYSLLLDGLMAEREQGITIDVAYCYFSTDKRSFIVADTPGHEEYTRNMAVGASFASLAVMLIDARKGVLTGTKRHARICKLMGISHFIFAVNKMDLVSYSEDIFNKTSSEISDLSSELSLPDVTVIPVSATVGDNITKKSENMKWYEGDPLLTRLENAETDDEKTEEGFYMPVERVSRPDSTFRGIQGQTESGEINLGDTISVLPSGEKAHIKNIFVGENEKQSAFLGQPVTITLDREVDVSRGCVIEKDASLTVGDSFKASLLWMDDSVLYENNEYIIKIGTWKTVGKVKRILYKIDVNTGEHIVSSSISKNEIALCEIALNEKIPLDTFKNHKALGELILIDRLTNMTSSCGTIEEILLDDENGVIFEGNGIRAKTLLFDEYFYSEKNMGIGNYAGVKESFSLNETIPLSGLSYDYPKNFDILALDSDAAIAIRNGAFVNIAPLHDYKYSGLPVVNGKGFSVSIYDNESVKKFFKDLNSLEKQEVYEKWMRFETYRRIIFTNNFWGL